MTTSRPLSQRAAAPDKWRAVWLSASNLSPLRRRSSLCRRLGSWPPWPKAARESPLRMLKTAIVMADRFASETPRMLAEHQGIVVALRSLITAAQAERQDDFVEFAEALMLHAKA